MNPKYGDADGEICPACRQLVGPEPGEIKFSMKDFGEYFENVGIDPNTLTYSEWRSFEEMFMSGIGWTEVVSIAVAEIKNERSAINAN